MKSPLPQLKMFISTFKFKTIYSVIKMLTVLTWKAWQEKPTVRDEGEMVKSLNEGVYKNDKKKDYNNYFFQLAIKVLTSLLSFSQRGMVHIARRQRKMQRTI